MPIKVTKKMLFSDSLVPFGEWYPVKVEKMEVGVAKKDKSTNYIYTLKFLEDSEFKDCSINPIYLNEKGAFGSSLSFIRCFSDPETLEAVKKGLIEEPEFDENTPIGQVILAKMGPNEYNGKITNQAIDFMPFK